MLHCHLAVRVNKKLPPPTLGTLVSSSDNNVFCVTSNPSYTKHPHSIPPPQAITPDAPSWGPPGGRAHRGLTYTHTQTLRHKAITPDAPWGPPGGRVYGVLLHTPTLKTSLKKPLHLTPLLGVPQVDGLRGVSHTPTLKTLHRNTLQSHLTST